MSLLRRKIDQFLEEWKLKQNHLPLIVKGARQIGKTASILQFAHHHYKYVVNINFVLQSKYREVFADGFEVDSIIKNITIISPTIQVVPGETLIFFDEIQSCPSCATSLKSFAIDGGYDVICSGSLMGIKYNEIEHQPLYTIADTEIIKGKITKKIDPSDRVFYFIIRGTLVIVC